MKLGKSIINYPTVTFPVTAKEAAEIDKEAKYLERANKRALAEMYTKDNPDAFKLREHLVAAAGIDMEINQETDFEDLLEHGEFYGETYEKISGAQRDSYKNCSKTWDKHPEKYSIVSGFALGNNGIWRIHDWLVDKDDNVFETTALRSLYFGIVVEERHTT